MYFTSTQRSLLSERELAVLEREGQLKFPESYRDFMKNYGDGTYGGALCINLPDFDVLRNYAEYDFWEYEGAPIRREQLYECVVIGNSIDGDYLAVHANVNGYILLPRGSDTIELFPCCDENFICILNKIGNFLYGEDLDDYFEPGVSKYLCLHALHVDMQKLAAQFKAAFGSDYLIENEYTCEVFLARMGGYVRFNLSYGYEVVIYYSDYGAACLEEVKGFLMEKGCKVI